MTANATWPMRVVVWGINYAPEFTGIAPHSVAYVNFCGG